MKTFVYLYLAIATLVAAVVFFVDSVGIPGAPSLLTQFCLILIFPLLVTLAMFFLNKANE